MLTVVAGLVLAALVSAVTAFAVMAGQPAAEPVSPPPRSPLAAPTPTPDEPESRDDRDLSDDELARRFGDAVFLVGVEGCGMAGSGSGFAIDERTVVTNHHVVAIDPTPVLVDRRGREFQGEVVGMSDDPDVAVIRVDEELPRALSWAPTADLSEGQHLVSLGFPAPENDFAVTPGTIQSFQTRDGVRQAIRYAGPLDKGNSGGPSLDGRGQVAGVVTEMALNLDGLQLVPLVFTHDALGEVIDDLAASTDRVEADCDAWQPPVVPDDWGWDDEPEPDGARPDGYGDDPELDALWEACADGDLGACDDLYWVSPYGSEYEWFGATCGDREPGWGYCLDDLDEYDDDWSEDPHDYGDDPELDGLYDDCSAGDMAACDDLYIQAPLGSAYETHGETCGGAGSYPCDLGDDDWDDDLDEYDDWPEEPHDYGDDPELDGLYDDCSAGDMAACDDLYIRSPLGSAYETHGETCGGSGSYPCDWD